MVPHLGVDGLVKFLSRWGETVDTVNFMSMRGVGRAGGGSRPRAGGPGADQKMRPRARAPPIGGQLRPPCPPSLTLSTEARAAALSVSAGAANAEVAARARTRKATRMVEEGVSVRGLVFFFFGVAVPFVERAHPALRPPHPVFLWEAPLWTWGRAGLFLYIVQLSLPRGQPRRPCGRGAGGGPRRRKKNRARLWGSTLPTPRPAFFCSFLLVSLKKGQPPPRIRRLHAPLLVLIPSQGGAHYPGRRPETKPPPPTPDRPPSSLRDASVHDQGRRRAWGAHAVSHALVAPPWKHA